MFRLSRRYPQLHTFHDLVTAPPRGRVETVRPSVITVPAVAPPSGTYYLSKQEQRTHCSLAPSGSHCSLKALSLCTVPQTAGGQRSGLKISRKQLPSTAAASAGDHCHIVLGRRRLATTAIMRDLVNISALGPSTALKVNASPRKPEERRQLPEDDGEGIVGSTSEVYQEAVRQLNTLQSNAKTLDAIRKNRDMGAYKNIPDVIDYANRIGVSLDRLDDLSCIHVAGTKGKGSVCAFTESILRSCGYKTGFYSSPHLVEVRERIRINGKPLPKEDFAKHFFTVYNRLEATKGDYGGKMPAYFRFLTLMAFHTFLEEKVDVAVIEVGIGGEYDCTNIIRKPIVVGITSLGMDHTSVLGNTIEKIAWQKAGIIKLGRPAFTVPQPGSATQVIQERAREREASLQVVPSLASYGFHGDHATLGLAGLHQRLNAALALQLAKTWVTEERPKDFFQDAEEPSCKNARMVDTPHSDEVLTGGDASVAQPFHLPEQFEKGLRSCYWAGRNQVIQRDNVTYYLDGAHTPRSIAACCKWFREKAEEEARTVEGPVAKILVFNSTGDRNEYTLLPKLAECGFTGAVFCPNIISLYSHDSAPDSMNYTTTTERQMKRCIQNMDAFRSLLHQLSEEVQTTESEMSKPIQSVNMDTHVPSTSNQHSTLLKTPPTTVAQSRSAFSQSDDGPVAALEGETGFDRFVQTKLVKLPSITDSLQWAACCKDKALASPSIHDPTPSDQAIAANHIQILVTGSIHLVGGVISILDPKLALEPDI